MEFQQTGCVEYFHFERTAPVEAALLAAECWPEEGLKTLKPSQSPQVPEAEQAGSQQSQLHTEQGRAISTLREQKYHSMYVTGHNLDPHWVDPAVFLGGGRNCSLCAI